MKAIFNEVRHALRALAKVPTYSLTCILVLAVGIGANTAIFSIVTSVILKALPYPEPSRLVFVRERFPTASDPLFAHMRAARANYLEWKRANTVFESMAAFQQQSLNETVNGEVRSTAVGFGAADLFPMLGVRARLGRLFEPGEERAGGLVAVLSDEYFERRFNRASAALGASLRLGDSIYTVVGVLPPRFHLPSTDGGDDQLKPEVWVPLPRLFKTVGDDNQRQLLVAARLKPGVTLAQARAEMAAIAARLATANPQLDEGWSAAISTFEAEDTSPKLHRALLVLLAAVGFLLLIACANLANLMLVRALSRSREMAIRLALGAGRVRIVAHLLTESLLISGAGAALGLAFAWAALKLMLALKPPDIQRPELITIDGTVLAFTAAAAFITAVLCGLAPAIGASRSDVQGALRAGGGWGATAGHKRPTRVLIAVEVALALVLVTGASLMIRSFRNLVATGIGFQTAHLEVADVELPEKSYPDEASRSRFFRTLLEAVSNLPGVTGAALTDNLPLHRVSAGNFYVAGRPEPPLNALPIADFANASPNYLTLLGLPVVAGRPLSDADREATERALASPKGGEGFCVVNRAFARRFFGGVNAVGQRLLSADKNHGCQIVGVVADYRPLGAENGARPQIFWPNLASRSASLIVRTTAAPEAAASTIRRTVFGLDRGLTLETVRPLEYWVDQWQSQRKFNTLLLSVFAGLALLLAIAGIYSVLANVVASRVREIGIRVAMGARPKQIGGLVLRQSLAPVAAGLGIGLGASVLLGRFLESLLFQVSARDPMTLALAALVILVVSPVAAFMPLRRALAVDCSVMLRAE
ncbi:MAG: ABC transporter permease [Bryobacterales bacterium]|nr:ABC transporter permease [Bryobacterales bacterium]